MDLELFISVVYHGLQMTSFDFQGFITQEEAFQFFVGSLDDDEEQEQKREISVAVSVYF